MVKRSSLKTGAQGASSITAAKTSFHSASRSAVLAGSTMALPFAAFSSSGLLQYHDQFQPRLTAPPQPSRPLQQLEASGSSTIHAIPPDQTIAAGPSPPAPVSA